MRSTPVKDYDLLYHFVLIIICNAAAYGFCRNETINIIIRKNLEENAANHYQHNIGEIYIANWEKAEGQYKDILSTIECADIAKNKGYIQSISNDYNNFFYINQINSFVHSPPLSNYKISSFNINERNNITDNILYEASDDTIICVQEMKRPNIKELRQKHNFDVIHMRVELQDDLYRKLNPRIFNDFCTTNNISKNGNEFTVPVWINQDYTRMIIYLTNRLSKYEVNDNETITKHNSIVINNVQLIREFVNTNKTSKKNFCS